LPDGLFSNQKYQFGYLNYGFALDWKNGYILWPFRIFYGHLGYFGVLFSGFGIMDREKSGNPANDCLTFSKKGFGLFFETNFPGFNGPVHAKIVTDQSTKNVLPCSDAGLPDSSGNNIPKRRKNIPNDQKNYLTAIKYAKLPYIMQVWP
jgi:hypothetical protein